MNNLKINFEYELYESADELSMSDASLLKEARDFTQTAYAPYSHFNVSAVARLANGEIIKGSNQENASYPVGICAERSLLSVAGSLYPGMAIDTLVVSYEGEGNSNDSPIAPCGMCRQALLEFENRTGHPMRVILSGKTGKVFVIKSASTLLPLSFSKQDLKNL
jgi:cytidine deaminase